MPDADDQEISPTRIRVGMAIVAAVIVIAIGVLITVKEPAAQILFLAIIVIGLFQMWRIFRANRRR